METAGPLRGSTVLARESPRVGGEGETASEPPSSDDWDEAGYRPPPARVDACLHGGDNIAAAALTLKRCRWACDTVGSWRHPAPTNWPRPFELLRDPCEQCAPSLSA